MHFLVLHGYDSAPERMADLADGLVASFDEATADLPFGLIQLEAGTFGWWGEDAEAPEISEAVDAVRGCLDDAGSIVVGFSQGGALAVALGAACPQQVRAVVCGGGFLPPGVEVSEGFPPLLVLHGDDDEVVDPFYAESLVRLARKAGANAELQTWPGAHTWPPDALERITTWLEAPKPGRSYGRKPWGRGPRRSGWPATR